MTLIGHCRFATLHHFSSSTTRAKIIFKPFAYLLSGLESKDENSFKTIFISIIMVSTGIVHVPSPGAARGPPGAARKPDVDEIG